VAVVGQPPRQRLAAASAADDEHARHRLSLFARKVRFMYAIQRGACAKSHKCR
jgi:hypothetical protein